ncbi:hypothetical protein AC781_11495 [Akkermansia glycaniphila]|nr:hypothetical protein [Akkermansia glycaniphila]OCA02176.1 hypothetical protein AC781_11495 [Akkermansia glycaniphila]
MRIQIGDVVQLLDGKRVTVASVSSPDTDYGWFFEDSDENQYYAESVGVWPWGLREDVTPPPCPPICKPGWRGRWRKLGRRGGMETFEYRVVKVLGFNTEEYEHQMNRLSIEGFELFKINTLPEGFFVSGGSILVFRKIVSHGKEEKP